MSTLHVGLIYGGRSSEHEVSVASAQNVFSALGEASRGEVSYDVTPLRIDRGGRWHVEDPATAVLHDPGAIPEAEGAAPGKEALLSPGGGSNATVLARQPEQQQQQQQQQQPPRERGAAQLEALALDVAFPMLHGQNGEDGRVQGLLEALGVPYVGAGVLASAACMDKEVAKRLLQGAGLPVVPSRVARLEGARPSFEEAAAALGAPLFVKPAGSGSSVGVSKVEEEAAYARALEEAFQYDNKVLIEEAVAGREIECAVVGNAGGAEAAVPGEIVSTATFYTYEDKYSDHEGAARMEVPADLPQGVAARVRDLSKTAYRTLGCEGMARVDFLMAPGHDLFVNEINTIPGFTGRSMFPVMWERAGRPLEVLLGDLIQLALDRHARDARLQTTR